MNKPLEPVIPSRHPAPLKAPIKVDMPKVPLDKHNIHDIYGFIKSGNLQMVHALL